MQRLRLLTSGYWKFTVPVTLRALLSALSSRVPRYGRSGHAPATPQAPGPVPARRQLRLAAALAASEVRGWPLTALRRLRPPEQWNFPLALFSYLFVVFALEVVFLRTFLPEERLPADEPVHATAPAPVLADDPDLAAEMRLLADTYLPAAHGQRLSPRQMLCGVQHSGAPFQAEKDDDLALLASAARHPLLRLERPTAPRPPEPAPGPEAFDSVRVAVARSSVTMPVDKHAFHPLDKEAFLAAASDPQRLGAIFARVRGPQAPPAEERLAALPGTAIAPPITRMDKIRMADARRRSLGSLSALFESGVRGVFAIGYDPKGGTSYGKYQLSSAKGAIRNFIKYLDKRAPSWAQQLRLAGVSNTGGTHGKMPRTWKRIAASHTKLFEKLQDDFIHSHYYSPTLAAVREKTGIDVDTQHTAIREVLWSTAVHHGPSGGARIFINASKRAKRTGGDFTRKLVREVYRERARRLSRIPLRQRSAIQARLKQEMNLALARLGKTVSERETGVTVADGLM